MINQFRRHYNAQFTEERYRNFLSEIENEFDHIPPFRIAETPIFVPGQLKQRIEEASNYIINFLSQPTFKELTANAIRHPSLYVPNEDYTSRFLQFDFGIVRDENGDLTPKLIELQGFPSLYFFQDYLALMFKKHFEIPDRFTVHMNGISRTEYHDMLREEIVGDADPRQVVLLEIEPEKQATQIDFWCAQKVLGIKVLCISKLIKKGRELYYKNDTGEEVRILKIYNRVIFDELILRPDIRREFYFRDEVDVEWVGHPHWFFRISKYTMPLFDHECVPDCFYLEQLDKYPDDLENYVLKPLYSFAGAGVRLHLSKELLDGIEDKGNYILQRKVKYEPVIETPDGLSKCEIRVMALHKSSDKSTSLVSNLVRLTKGEMVGVKYNKDKTWVGGSVAFFDEE